MSTEQSDNITFYCIVYGDEGTISWEYKSRNISSEDNKYTVVTQYDNYTTTSELTISNPSTSDTGNYTCTMSYNSNTNVTSIGNLYVMGEFFMYFCSILGSIKLSSCTYYISIVIWNVSMTL